MLSTRRQRIAHPGCVRNHTEEGSEFPHQCDGKCARTAAACRKSVAAALLRDATRGLQRLQQSGGVRTALPWRTVTASVVQPLSPAWLRPATATAVTA
jgi:hypothetical protein